ncbi:MAG: protein kinase [Lachnospiraceae bacterium]|nr:protein kinase [Lachnospiraceae bacterium]
MQHNDPSVLADDLKLLREQLDEFTEYDFVADLKARMAALHINQHELAIRAQVSHVAVGKWLKGDAKPRGKERFKELGMALGMNEAELGSFLLANNYPRLYIKNPLDALCRTTLLDLAGKEGIVGEYKKSLLQNKLNSYSLADSPDDIPTFYLDQMFMGDVKTINDLKKWIMDNDKHFSALDKIYIPHPALIRFIQLYSGGQSINDRYITGQLPVALRNLLYPLVSDKEIAVKGLRAKLIVYGLYENMNELEIDQMLTIVGLQPISEPLSKIDCVLFGALLCAHVRYPYYDLNNAEKLLDNIHGCEGVEYKEFQKFYETQLEQAEELVNYYDKEGHKSDIDRLFEEAYTDYSGSGLLWYVQDILQLLAKENRLPKEDTDEYLSLMKTYKSKKAVKCKRNNMPASVTLSIKKGALSGQSFIYTGKESLILGRQSDCTIVFPEEDATVSRHHCRIDIAPPSVVVRDLDTLNGTFLNGEKIGQRGIPTNDFSMKSGDRLGLGKDCELVLTIHQPRAKQIKEVRESNSNRLCEVCGATLADDNSPGICEKCHNDPDNLMIQYLRHYKKPNAEATEIAGYKKVRLLGQGGMGKVWLVEEEATTQQMALKVMLPQAAVNEKSRNIFIREATISGQLEHKNIIKQHKFGDSGDVYFILMEYCDGGNLVDLMNKHGGKLPVDMATDIILQVMEGLIYAHSASLTTTMQNGDTVSVTGIVHRDLKPSNIFLCGSGKSFVAKVADFGIAKAFETAGLSGNTRTNQMGGTPVFMSRKQIRNYKYAKPDVDVWAAAASYYYMLTGLFPKDYENSPDVYHAALCSEAIPIRKRDSSIPIKLAEVIDHALIEEPIRVSSALEFQKMIEGAL